MKVLWVGILVAFAFAFSMFGVQIAQASANETIVISQVQVGNASSSRLVELYNNSDIPMDVTGWCIKYATASGAVSTRACFTTTAATERLVLPAWSYILVGSSQLSAAADYVMTEGLGSGSVGSVYVVDASGQAKDIFGWGTTTYAEGAAKASDSATRVYERKQSSPGVYIDNGNNGSDFFNSVLRESPGVPYQINALREMTDVCVNIEGIQQAVPSGLVLGEFNQCVDPPVDVCVNIDGVQVELPDDTEVGEDGTCYIDACVNLPKFQHAVPLGYNTTDDHLCGLSGLGIQITEILANPDGEDNGNEFVEFYNPNDVPVDLTFHVVHLNGDDIKSYIFRPGTIIAPKGYLVVYNADMSPSFTLTNTQGSMQIRAFDGSQIMNVPAYADAKSGESWAIVDSVWQYTPLVTPGEKNKASPLGQGAAGSIAAMDCGEGRERNPVTNRCRNITVASVPAACKEGQYRNEEMNRCRSIASVVTSLKPCADNQFRNPATNRCRTIASSDDVTDCGEGRERNPETNRCRNVLGATSVPESAFKVEPVKDGTLAFVGWWALGALGLFAAAYAAWEWRSELAGGFHFIISYLSGKR